MHSAHTHKRVAVALSLLGLGLAQLPADTQASNDHPWPCDDACGKRCAQAQDPSCKFITAADCSAKARYVATCPALCGMCTTTTTVATKPAATAPPNTPDAGGAACEDVAADTCEQYASQCEFPAVQKSCPQTCGACAPATTKPVATTPQNTPDAGGAVCARIALVGVLQAATACGLCQPTRPARGHAPSLGIVTALAQCPFQLISCRCLRVCVAGQRLLCRTSITAATALARAIYL